MVAIGKQMNKPKKKKKAAVSKVRFPRPLGNTSSEILSLNTRERLSLEVLLKSLRERQEMSLFVKGTYGATGTLGSSFICVTGGLLSFSSNFHVKGSTI